MVAASKRSRAAWLRDSWVRRGASPDSGRLGTGISCCRIGNDERGWRSALRLRSMTSSRVFLFTAQALLFAALSAGCRDHPAAPSWMSRYIATALFVEKKAASGGGAAGG